MKQKFFAIVFTVLLCGFIPTSIFAIEPTDSLHTIWASYFGGSASENLSVKVATDNDGSVYIATTTSSFGIATLNARIGSYNNCILAKFSSAGALLWSRYYGGTNTNLVSDLAIDSDGNVILVGNTYSDNITMSENAYQPTKPAISGYSGFIAKFGSAGGILWNTYFGGSNQTKINSLIVDAGNNIYIAGETQNGLLNISGTGTDAFVAKLSSTGTYSWGTLVGGSGSEIIYDICMSPTGSIFAIGQSNTSTNFATNTFNGGSYDAFISKISGAGSVEWSKFIGGSSNDVGYLIGVDTTSNIIAGIETHSSNLEPNGFQQSYSGATDCYIIKSDSTGNRIWDTYFGGTDNDNINSMKIIDGNIIMFTGSTESSTGITSYAEQATISSSPDGFYCFMYPTGSLLKSSYFGSTGSDVISDVVCIRDKYYFVGNTNSGSLISDGTFQSAISGNYDGFISVQSSSLITQSVSIDSIATNEICAGSDITIYLNIEGFTASDIFQVQLSDASGSFSSPTILHSFSTGDSILSISTEIQNTTLPGTSYMIRIVCPALNFFSAPSEAITVYPGTSTLNSKLFLNGSWNGTSQKRSAAVVELRTGRSFARSTLVAYYPLIIATDGTFSLDLSALEPDQYWIVVKVPGFLSLATSKRLRIPNCNANNLNIDFTVAQSLCSNQSNIMFQNASSQYVLKIGDLDRDNLIRSSDQQILQSANGASSPGIPE